MSVWVTGISKHLSWDLVRLQMTVVEQMKERRACGSHEAKVISAFVNLGEVNIPTGQAGGLTGAASRVKPLAY